MSQFHQYHLDGFLLKVNDFAYLVEIESTGEKPARKANPADLPSWIFDSEHAIWLTDENLPIKDRAARGDRVKEKLMKFFFGGRLQRGRSKDSSRGVTEKSGKDQE
jgi:hypothetical protein